MTKLPDGRIVVTESNLIQVEPDRLTCESAVAGSRAMAIRDGQRLPPPESQWKIGETWGELLCMRSRSQWDITK
jgi:hypothetical protein